MKRKPPRLIFDIEISVFTTLLRAKLSLMRRDRIEFLKYGVTVEKMNDFEVLIKDFEDYPTDPELLGIQMEASEVKEEFACNVRIDVLNVMYRAEGKFGKDSGKYMKFGVSEISQINGGKLFYVARRAYRVANIYLSELEGEGLTADMLQTYRANLDLYDKSLADQEDAIYDRLIVTEIRVEKANNLYRMLVGYCDKGKQIWESVNEAKYNDYIIYNTPLGGQKE